MYMCVCSLSLKHSILLKKKKKEILRLRKIEQVPQICTARTSKSWGLNPGFSGSNIIKQR